jgi:hypothetical protein
VVNWRAHWRPAAVVVAVAVIAGLVFAVRGTRKEVAASSATGKDIRATIARSSGAPITAPDHSASTAPAAAIVRTQPETVFAAPTSTPPVKAAPLQKPGKDPVVPPPPVAQPAPSQVEPETKLPVATPSVEHAFQTPSVAETNAVPAPQPKLPTAMELLVKGNAYVAARSKDRIFEMIAARTDLERAPASWRLIYYDEKATFKTVEVRFESGEMERMFEPSRVLDVFSRGESKTLDLTKVKVDSDEAIRIAANQCDTNIALPKFVEAKLERGYGGLPVWNIKLSGMVAGKAAEDASIGYVILLAEDGKVLKKDLATEKVEKPTARK